VSRIWPDRVDSDKHTIGRWASERQHEPPGGPEFESALNQRIRVGTACRRFRAPAFSAFVRHLMGLSWA
jgi:hypothetical protein